jgi:Arc/MetJ-type ribon-helix-helix transcriptional regulator
VSLKAVPTIPYSVPVPAEMDEQIKRRMKAAGFNSRSEYVRAAIRADLEQAAKQELEGKLLRAVERGNYKDASAFLQELHAHGN